MQEKSLRKHAKNKLFCFFLSTITSFYTLTQSPNAQGMEQTIGIKVNVVNEACNIISDDNDLKLDFGSIVKKSLYLENKSPAIPFSIHLVNCNPEVAKTVSVKFTGNESIDLPGMLSLSPSSSAKGIAIGIQKENGSLLKINSDIDKTPISKGSMTLNYKSFVQGLPIKSLDNGITPGIFSATATYLLTYN